MSGSLGVDQILSELSDLAPTGFGIALHIRAGTAHIRMNTYDPNWMQTYTENGYMFADPVYYWGFGYTGATRWSDIDLPDPRNVFNQARAFGLNYGIVVSTGPMSSRTLGGFSREDREFTQPEIDKIQRLIKRLHTISAPPERLTPAQRTALRLVAGGNRHAEAAGRLGITESAFKARLRSARDRLNTRTTAEAVQRAQEYNLL